MRTYTFKRECGHTVRGTNKAASLARPCNDCILRILESESLPMDNKQYPCECSDPGCSTHKGKESCQQYGYTILYRVDMQDETGTMMCIDCADDAFSSGVFTTRDEELDDDEQLD